MIGVIAAADGIINLDAPVAGSLTEWEGNSQKLAIT